MCVPAVTLVFTILEWDGMDRSMHRLAFGVMFVALLGVHRATIAWRVVERRRRGFEFESFVLLLIIRIINAQQKSELVPASLFQKLILAFQEFIVYGNGAAFAVFIVVLAVSSLYSLISLTHSNARLQTVSDVGLSQSELNLLEVQLFSAQQHAQIDCTICLQEFEEDVEVKQMPECRHVFHRDCIDYWLKTNCKCPNCRRDIREGIQHALQVRDQNDEIPVADRVMDQILSLVEPSLDSQISLLQQEPVIPPEIVHPLEQHSE